MKPEKQLGDWITWHTSVYDIAKKKLTVWSQEEYAYSRSFLLDNDKEGVGEYR